MSDLLERINKLLHKDEKTRGLVTPKDVMAKPHSMAGKVRRKRMNVEGGPMDEPISPTKERRGGTDNKVSKVIMEWVHRGDKMFLRRRTIRVNPEEEEAHDKVVKVYLSTEHLNHQRWVEFAMQTYARNIKFTHKKEGYAVWNDPQDPLQYIIYKHHDDAKKTVLVYNSKLTEKVLLRAFNKSEQSKQENLEEVEAQQKREGVIPE
jgi:hypothetical protein